MRRSNRRIIITGILMALLVATSSFAETIKLGLPEWGWGSQYFTTMDDVNDVRSTRFTAYEDVTVDRVLQYLYSIDSTNTSLRIGIQSDSGGEPSGTWLNSAVFDPAEGSSFDFAVFGSVSLTNGYVYHVVTEFDTLGSPESFRLYNSSFNYDTRPYDRQIDASMQILDSIDGGSSWRERPYDPFFVFANGDHTAIVQGPGNPYQSWRQSTFVTRGGTGGAMGTRWQFASYEAGGYESVTVTNININVKAGLGAQTPTNSLIIRVCESDGTILASTTVATNQISEWKSYELDSQITLSADTPYLITTEFGGNGGTRAEYYLIYAIYAYNHDLFGAQAGYGSTNSVVPIRSNDRWANWAKSNEDWEIPFWFDAEPIEPPPPGTLILIN